MTQQNNSQLSIADALGLVSFLLGIANYSENLSQTQFQDELHKAVQELHSHLESQDNKIDQILSLLQAQQGGESIA